MNGIYVGNDTSNLSIYEGWLGRKAEAIQLHTGRASWSDWEGSIGWLASVWKGVDREKYWTIPLIPKGATLAAAAAGNYDAYYKAGAADLLAASPGSDPIPVRTGWEFNGDWQPWAAKGKEADYKAAFRNFVFAFRSVSDRFTFEWAPNVGDLGMNPADAYPGDDVVDVIGFSMYVHPSDPSNPTDGWNMMVERKYGLAWHRDFAASHGKKAAMSEWGVRSNNAGPYVDLASAWFDKYDYAYQSYWDSNADYPGQLSRQQYPDVSDEFRNLVVSQD